MAEIITEKRYDKNLLRPIIYYDPNQEDDSLDLMKKLEDYSISVDLEVEIPSRDNYIDKETYSLSWKSKAGDSEMSSASFFMGSKVGGSNVLSDFYTDLNFDPSNPTENNEAIGISSIDIDYDSWYLPKVTIKFIDLRGGALFNSAQYFHDTDQPSNNLFRAFFTMPYPLFKLRFKGFYGDAVTLPLYLIDFRAEFNSSTGDFEIITQFVGYTYAFLADIPFNLLRTAPYNENYVSEYWQNQVNNGRFRLVDENGNLGIKMPTLINLMTDINDAQDAISKLMSSDSDVETLSKIKSSHNKLANVIDAWKSALFNFETEFGGDKNNTYEQNDNEAKFIDARKEIEFSDLKNRLSDINKLIDQYNELVTNDNDKITEKINFPPKKDPRDDGLFLYTFNYSVFWSKLRSLNNVGKDQLIEARENVSGKLEDIVVEYLEFNPTVNNIFRILFAHLETFMATYYQCLDNISTSGRTVSDHFSDADNTDINTSDIDNTFLSPFPATYENGKEIWIGINRNQEMMEEERYVYSIINATNNTSKILTDLLESSNNDTKNYWFPINPFDTYFTNRNHNMNPYSELRGSDFQNLVVNIGLRMFYGLTMASDNPSSKTISKIAKIEAKNIVEIFSDNSSIMSNFDVTNIDKVIIDLLLGKKTSFNTNHIVLPNAEKNNDGSYNTGLMFNSINTTNQGYQLKYLTTESRYEILPLYVDTVKGFSKTWFCDNENYPTPKVKDSKPFITNSINSVSDTNNSKTFFSIHENIDEFIGFKTAIDEKDKKVLDNWKLDVNEVAPYFNFQYISNSLYPHSYDPDKEKKDKGIVYLPEIYNEDASQKLSVNDKNDKNWFEINKLKNSSSGSDYLKMREDGGVYTYSNFISETFKGQKTSNVSLFGSLFYYGQNDTQNRNRLGKNDSKVDNTIKLSKASLFLSMFGISNKSLNNIFETKEPSSRRIPKIAMLKLGSILWKYKYAKEMRVDPIYYPSPYYKQPNSIYSLLESPIGVGSNKNYKSIGNVFNNIIDKNGEFSIKPQVINQVIDYFKDWVNKEYGYISGELELRVNEGSHEMNSSSLFKIVNSYSDLLDDKDNDLETSEFYKDFGSGLFKNYIRLVPVRYVNKKRIFLGGIKLENISGLYLEHRGGTYVMDKIIDLLRADVVVINTTHNLKNNHGKSSGFVLAQTQVSSYVTTLVNEIKDLTRSTTQTYVDNQEVTVFNNDAVCLSLYKTLKNLYDKWCASKTLNDYTLENFYSPKFKFIDKFYNDIGDKMIINVEIFNDILKGGVSNESVNLYSVISELLSKHEMLFIPSATNINWVDSYDTLRKVFQPIPYSQQSFKNYEPGFTGIYVGQPSTNLDHQNSKNKTSDDALRAHPISNFPDVESDGVAYPVPCFSVSYGKQNQSYFNDFSINMNNPINTEQSLQAIYNLSQRGGGNNRVAQGQELYNIYTRNSYQVTANMMGCAQIQPMMYFQLSNIPLFNGCYMIHKVNHRITPGNMTTSFTGMRMSRIAPMYTKEAFIIKSFLSDFDDSDVDRIGKSLGSLDTKRKNDNNMITRNLLLTGDPLNTPKVVYGSRVTGASVKETDTYVDYPKLKNNFLGGKGMGTSRYFTLKDFVENSSGNQVAGRRTFDDAGKMIPLPIYENMVLFSAYLDEIKIWFDAKYGKQQKIVFDSLWRVKWNSDGYETFHGIGSAADIKVYDRVDGSMNKTILMELYKHIKENLPYKEVFFETNQKGTSWVHYAYHPNSNKEPYASDNFPG